MLKLRDQEKKPPGGVLFGFCGLSKARESFKVLKEKTREKEGSLKKIHRKENLIMVTEDSNQCLRGSVKHNSTANQEQKYG